MGWHTIPLATKAALRRDPVGSRTDHHRQRLRGICCPTPSQPRAGQRWDGTFLVLDRSLGFDWLAYLHGQNERPWLGDTLSSTYGSLMPQIAPLVILLGFTGRLRAVREFVLAFVLAAVIYGVLSVLLPVFGI